MYVITDVPGPMQPEKKVDRQLVNLTGITSNSDDARKIAFRLVNKRKEKDWCEIANNTLIYSAVPIDKSMADFILAMQ